MTRHRTCRLAIVFIVLCLASCTWRRRLPLQSPSFSLPVPHVSSKVTVLLEPSVPGHPLSETVWDNSEGAFWNPEESRQIGFDQNYNHRAAIVPPGFWWTAQTSGFPIIDSRLVVPFGSVFSSTFEAASRQVFSDPTLCFNEECVNPAATTLVVAVDQFYVWESPENHLNLYGKIRSFWTTDKKDRPAQAVERTMEREDLGGPLTTHSGLIVAMNHAVNRFAEELSAEVLRQAAEGIPTSVHAAQEGQVPN